MSTLTQNEMQLVWKPAFSTSWLHAAHAIGQNHELVDPDLAKIIQGPVTAFERAIESTGVPREPLWQNLLGLSVEIENNRQLALQALTKTVGASRAELLAGQFAGVISDLEVAGHRVAPALEETLLPYLQVLREQWSMAGLPLMERVAIRTDARLIVPRAVVAVVWPITRGGDGGAHLPFNSVHIEAVADSPAAPLPEIVRLGWLLAQLNLDIPIFCDAVNLRRLPLVARLAILPPTLEAAQQLDLIEPGSIEIPQALSAWGVLPAAAPEVADVVADWWATYQESRPRWEVALTALDRMMGEIR